MHQLNAPGQHALDAIAEYSMRVAATYFHDIKRAVSRALDGSDERLDLLDQDFGPGAVAKFVDVLHVPAPRVAANCIASISAWASPSSVKIFNVSAAWA